MLSVLLPQAPRECKWVDVQQLLHHGHKVKFLDFAKGLQFSQVPYVANKVQTFDSGVCTLIQRDWRAALFRPRDDDEALVRPIIHNLLQCVALRAESNSTPAREFLVLSEPAVDAYTKDRVSDEAVAEVVADGGLFRILVEVKGSRVLLKDTPMRIPRQPFCQLIQEVALALKSGMWKGELLGAVATHNIWQLFIIKDVSEYAGRIQLYIAHCYYAVVQDPSIHSMYPLLDFLTQYLCK